MDLGSVGRVRDCTGSGPLIPGHMAGLFLLSPGAPVNNCRWASIHMSWDQCRKSDPGTYTGQESNYEK